MKVQFGSALSDETKTNAYITIPGLRGMPSKEISVKNLSMIIEARMREILDFVDYHLKQVGMDNRMLNGGIIITGGGSQLKHLLQLTEYVTGLNARVGLPNEHLVSNHIEELKKPMYSTCIGLILKGYNDFDNKHKEFQLSTKNISVPNSLKDIVTNTATVVSDIDAPTSVDVTDRIEKIKGPGFWDKIKMSLVDIFKEEDDRHIG